MRKAFLLFLGLAVAFASSLISCTDNKDKDDFLYNISVNSTDGGSARITNYIGKSANVIIGSTIELVAVANEGYKFIGWYIGDNNTPVSTNSFFSFIVNEDVSLLAKFRKKARIGNAIDIGLSVRWADFNVGATKPEEYGGYYAWGEIEEKDTYTWDNYKWCIGSSNTITKYCTSSRYGYVDNKTVLDLEDDVANMEWGGNWRIPTEDELDELIIKCNWVKTTLNGVNGYKVIGPNGNSIFFPAAGYDGGTSKGEIGYIWTSTLWNSHAGISKSFSINYEIIRLTEFYERSSGFSVRPVCW